MPTITINGRQIEAQDGQVILQAALDNEIEIPHYCYHPGLSIVANCRICLAEVWAPNPRNDNKLEPIPKLLPTCQTTVGEGQVIYTDSPKAIANQKAVMEYLLINHPVDCAVCDQAGECHLQDYSYQYGRSRARFREQKIKQPKKDVGPHVLLYSDRCIMCTRCVRFTREVTETNELIVEGRGALEQIDVFPGMALDNELSGNVVDLCPVGALLDKDFLFQQRVWFLTKTPSIDGMTASGDNITVEHNKGEVYRIKPRMNLDVNRYWITDEVRYGWRFIHDPNRHEVPVIRNQDRYAKTEAAEAYDAAYDQITDRLSAVEEGQLAVSVSPMLSCEDAWQLAQLALLYDPKATFAVGPIPHRGEDKTFADGYKIYAEKAPNARGVRRVLETIAPGKVLDHDGFIKAMNGSASHVILTGNYGSEWVTPELSTAVNSQRDRFVLLLDTLPHALTDRADVLIPAATWVEKAGTFENAANRLQTFERAIQPIDYCKSEGQIALDLINRGGGVADPVFNAAETRAQMADAGLDDFVTDIHVPAGGETVASDMEMVSL